MWAPTSLPLPQQPAQPASQQDPSQVYQVYQDTKRRLPSCFLCVPHAPWAALAGTVPPSSLFTRAGHSWPNAPAPGTAAGSRQPDVL